MIQYDRRLLYWSKKTMVKKQTYDWKKTATKVARISIEIILAGALAYATNRPELLALVPALEGLYNYWKHR
jgi:hypothetical protein